MSSAVAPATSPPANSSTSNGNQDVSVNGASRPNGQMPSSTGQASVTSIPPQMQQILMSMNKEKLQQMVVRMKSLQAAGETEQSSQEYANLVSTFRYFQQVQSMRQQQGEFDLIFQKRRGYPY